VVQAAAANTGSGTGLLITTQALVADLPKGKRRLTGGRKTESVDFVYRSAMDQVRTGIRFSQLSSHRRILSTKVLDRHDKRFFFAGDAGCR
jgi:hypothetical protein